MSAVTLGLAPEPEPAAPPEPHIKQWRDFDNLPPLKGDFTMKWWIVVSLSAQPSTAPLSSARSASPPARCC
jgi:hypothetical protein